MLSSTVGSAIGEPGGTVSFFDGDVALGTVAVSAGSASRTLTGVATGPHDYRAVFTPTLDRPLRRVVVGHEDHGGGAQLHDHPARRDRRPATRSRST